MGTSSQKPGRDLLFWSGGKDAFLALRYYQAEYNTEPVLITTFERSTKIVPHQNVPIESIYSQALYLKLPLFSIPLPHPASNEVYLQSLKESFDRFPFNINRLMFGDLHLQDIRDWREEQFSQMNYNLLFPIWHKPYNELFNKLEKENIRIHISNVSAGFKKYLSPGQIFNRKVAESLPDDIDKMGENGEFHTEVEFL